MTLHLKFDRTFFLLYVNGLLDLFTLEKLTFLTIVHNYLIWLLMHVIRNHFEENWMEEKSMCQYNQYWDLTLRSRIKGRGSRTFREFQLFYFNYYNFNCIFQFQEHAFLKTEKLLPGNRSWSNSTIKITLDKVS